ncbi:transmembrane and coiled-coil domains protein 1-like [Gambusia affinis]|uniref:Uncharacterized protein n=1 Tax=Gambusia affinis TaxID=33528 RepID=A0A315UNM8_GAMAF|nr:transmembrane and coiled-coil domains protein 1-like [Gambusia affinis]PWA13945.1 hypothetical protein CCH79_00018098 [Gambusia affinis]
MHESHEGEARGRSHSSSLSSADKLQSSSTRSRSSSRETVKCQSENQAVLLNAALSDIQQIRETQKNLEKSLKALRTEYQQNHNQMLNALEEERSRLNVLERELTYLTELHHRETSNLQEEISSTKKIIDIRFNGKAEEFSVALEKCQSHLMKMELQQQQEMDIVRNEYSTAQIIIGKLIRGLLVIMSTILVFVCTLNKVILLFKSSRHFLTAVLLAVFLFLLFKYWNTPT